MKSEIEPTLSDSLRALGTNVSIFPIFYLFSSLGFDVSGSMFLRPFFVNPQKLYKVTITGHTPYQVSAMYKIIIVMLTQRPGLGEIK